MLTDEDAVILYDLLDMLMNTLGLPWPRVKAGILERFDDSDALLETLDRLGQAAGMDTLMTPEDFEA